jgi:predicted AlkP superfamily pyrophosphatase or phosphodiesterase
VVELIWFTTDALGHALGQRLYRASIRRFDRYFGNLIKRLNLNEVNLILYCDHGMSFGDFSVINQDKEIKRIVGDNLRIFTYPNLYLKNPEVKDEVTKDIILESEIDFAFYKEGPHRVIGYSDQGEVYI